jgi:CheY-like chemotaxis protein
MPPLSATHTVLYVEDNLSNLTLIEHLLADHAEIKLITAMQGRLGLDLARQHHPDLILLDLHLPDMPGWEVLAQLQSDDATRNIPVVAVSADATPRQIERLLKAGARAYLTKPLEVDRFHAMLREILEPPKS